jgi:IS30 family transposase
MLPKPHQTERSWKRSPKVGFTVVLSGQLSNHGTPSTTLNRAQSRPIESGSPPRARLRRLSTTAVEQIVSAYLAGTTIRQISRDLDMHRTTVDNCLKRAGVKRPRQPVLSEADLQSAEVAYRAGDSWITIAKRLDVDPATIGYHLKRRGVPMRPRRGGIRHTGTDR